LIVASVVLVVIVVALIIGLASGGNSNTKPAASDPASVLKAISSVPESVFTRVGVGSANNAPKAIDDPPLTLDGMPHVAYVGAEFCPYCAAERWAMAVALSRFGTFTRLPLSHSAVEDTFSNTQTVTFRGSEYRSDVLAFTGTETAGNELVGGRYEPLDTPPEAVAAAATSHRIESIPFVDFGGKYLLSGATYDPGVLAGKSAVEIARALSDADSDIAKGVIGSANVLTAAICKATGNQPTSVCGSTTIAGIAKKLSAGTL